MEKKREQELTDQEAMRLTGNFMPRSPQAPGRGEAFRQGKRAAPGQPQSGTGGTMTKKRRRPIHLHVMVSEEEQALIRERMARGGHPKHGSLYAENGVEWVCAPC